MDLADGCGAIAVPNGPTTARGTHRGGAPTLDGGVLLVPLGKNVPLNTSHVRWDRDLGAGHSCGWWMVDGTGNIWKDRTNFWEVGF